MDILTKLLRAALAAVVLVPLAALWLTATGWLLVQLVRAL